MSTRRDTAASGSRPSTTSASAPWRALARHYLEMVLAMLAGMVVLGPLRGASGLSVSAAEHPTANYLLMALDMSTGMAVVMRWRRHRWGDVAEMCGAMLLPAALFPTLSMVLSSHVVMMIAHVAMFVLMLVIVLARWDTYGGHRRRARGSAPDLHRRVPDG